MSTLEHDSILDKIFPQINEHVVKLDNRLKDLVNQAGEEWSVGNGDVTGASGGLNLSIFDVPEGYRIKITRILLWADGFTPAAPYSNAACWGGIFIGKPSPQNMIDFFPPAPGGVAFPTLAEFSGDGAPVLRLNDSVSLQVTAGPINTNITCMLWGKKVREKKSHGIS